MKEKLEKLQKISLVKNHSWTERSSYDIRGVVASEGVELIEEALQFYAAHLTLKENPPILEQRKMVWKDEYFEHFDET